MTMKLTLPGQTMQYSFKEDWHKSCQRLFLWIFR